MVRVTTSAEAAAMDAAAIAEVAKRGSSAIEAMPMALHSARHSDSVATAIVTHASESPSAL